MNIQQLNGNGQSVWVFVVTAVIALFITAGTWYLSEAANTYRNWQRRCARRLDRGGAKPRTFGMAERVAMIVWLRRNGYVSWMRSTGAGWKILFNRSDPFLVALRTGDGTWRTSAGDLVSRYSFGELGDVDLWNCRAAKSEEMASPASLP